MEPSERAEKRKQARQEAKLRKEARAKEEAKMKEEAKVKADPTGEWGRERISQQLPMRLYISEQYVLSYISGNL